MKRAGRDRRALLVAMTPPAPFIVDIGSDHGHVAHAVGAYATERRPHRTGRLDLNWIIADGLRPFRDVDVAIVAGMGALTIIGILADSPPPRVAVLHCPDDPPRLRRWLAGNGWRIEAEGLAREAGRFAEVVRARPGTEPHTGLELEFGPRLPQDPLWPEHVRQLLGHWTNLAEATAGKAPEKHADAMARVQWLSRW